MIEAKVEIGWQEAVRDGITYLPKVGALAETALANKGFEKRGGWEIKSQSVNTSESTEARPRC